MTKLDLDTVGSYTIQYSARDSSGNLGTAFRTVNVVADETAPSIILLGDQVVTHEAGQEYMDAGGDIADGDGNLMVGKKAAVDVGDLDTSKPGGPFEITLAYNSADGKEVTPLTRIVNVVDTTPPKLVLKGEAEIKILVGEPYDILEAPGATFTDNVDPPGEVNFTIPPSGFSGLVLHLDASFPGEPYNDGDVMINGMRDLSGKGHHAGNILGNPTWIANGLNGQPIVNFDGDDMIWTSRNFENDLANHTLLTVARYTGGDSERVISTRDRNWLFGFYGNRVNQWHADGWISNQAGTDTKWHLHVGDINNKDQGNFWRDGVQLATNSNGANNNSYKPRCIQLGGWNTGHEMSKCEVAEVLLYDRILDQGQLDAVQALLDAKYGLDPTEF